MRSASGSIPRSKIPEALPPRVTMPCSSMYGAAATIPGNPSSLAICRRQSERRPSRPEIVACAVRLRIRVRNSSSKPFITDSTTISTATPSASPIIAIPAIKETTPRRGEARR